MRHDSTTAPKHIPETTRGAMLVSCALFLQPYAKITIGIDKNEMSHKIDDAL